MDTPLLQLSGWSSKRKAREVKESLGYLDFGVLDRGSDQQMGRPAKQKTIKVEPHEEIEMAISESLATVQQQQSSKP